jgi:AcrR family transcriptional regulator
MSPRTQVQNRKIREESQQKILAAAFKLMSSNGYESTSIAQIAKEAGISKGLMYNYFGSKEELLKALINRTLNDDEILTEVIAEDPVKTLENVFRWFFDELRNNLSEWRFISEIMLKADRYSFVKEMISIKMTKFMGNITALLTEVGYPDPENEAFIIGGLVDGIGFGYLVVGEDYPIDNIEKYLINKYCKKR